MAEKIILFELDIQDNQVKQKLNTLKSDIERLKIERTELAKKTKQLAQSEKTLIQLIEKSTKETGENSEQTKKLKEELARTTQELKKTSSSLANIEVRQKKLNEEYRTYQTILKSTTKLNYEKLGVIEKTNGSITQLSAALAHNKKIYAGLSKEERENEQIGGRLLKIIRQQDAEYKKLHNSIGNTQVNVGNYKQAIIDASREMGIFGSIQLKIMQIQKASKTVMLGLSSSFKTAAKGTGFFTKALKLLRVAIISTGIGALIIALTSVTTWFSRTQAGGEALRKVMASIGAVINVIIDRFAKIGGAIIGFITGQKSLSEAWKEGKEAVSGLTDEMAREYELARKLEEQLIELEKAEIMLNLQRAASRRRIAELHKIADNRNLAEQKRLRALAEANALEIQLAREEKKHAEQSLANMLGRTKAGKEVEEILQRIAEGSITANELISQLGISESTVEDLKEFEQAFVKYQQTQEKITKISTTTQNKIMTIMREVEAEERKNYKARLERAKKLKEEQIKALEYEIEIFREKNRNVLNDTKITSEQELQIRKLTVRALFEAEKNVLKTRLKLGLISEKEYNLSLIKLKNEYLEKAKSLDDAYLSYKSELTQKEIEEEKKKQDYIRQIRDYEYELEKQRAELQTNAKEELARLTYEREIGLLEEKYKKQLITDEQYEQAKTLLRKRYEKTRHEIAAEKQIAETQMLETFFGRSKKLFKEHTLAYKALAIAETTANTYAAVMQLWKQPSVIPSPANEIYKSSMSAIIIATGLANVAKISGIKFAKGGLVGGKLHSEGGTKYYGEDGQVFEVEKGEAMFVLNRKAQREVLPFLDYINRKTGGVPLITGKSHLATGGMVQPQIITNISTNSINELIDEKIQNIRVINVATETADVLDEIYTAKNTATF